MRLNFAPLPGQGMGGMVLLQYPLPSATHQLAKGADIGFLD